MTCPLHLVKTCDEEDFLSLLKEESMWSLSMIQTAFHPLPSQRAGKAVSESSPA